MPLATLNDMLPGARQGRCAIGAFNIGNYETAKAVILAAEAEQQPVILQVYQRLMADPHIGALAAMMRYLAEQSSVPVAVHLDHGVSLEQVRKAIDVGFSSVMLDGSSLPFQPNLELTREAAEYAHRYGVTIEGEMGHVPINGADGAASVVLTAPEEAARFAEATGVDALAVGIGTAHGYYLKTPELRMDLARAIRACVAVPLVLHGGSGTPRAQIREVIRFGFAKVNVATEFQHLFQQRLGEALQAQGDVFLPIDKLVQPVTEGVVLFLREWIRFFARAGTQEL